MPRADARVDDRHALAGLGETDPGYVARATSEWAADTAYRWAVCEPTTGELLAEVTLDPAAGQICTRHRSGFGEAADTAAAAVSRFAAGALGLAPRILGPGGTPAADQHPG